MSTATRRRIRLSGGTELSFLAAGEATQPAVLLLHGFPSSARTFRAESWASSSADYAQHVEQFDIADYLARWQPPALMLWGRHDPYYELAEILSWLRALPRMETHVLDGGHFLLETHANQAVRLMLDFIRRTRPASDARARRASGQDSRR